MSGSVSDISGVVNAGASVVGLLAAGIGFIWARVEKINRDRKAEIARCTRQRELDRIQGRERRATLLTVIKLLVNVVRRFDPHAPEIGETREMLADFEHRERAEAEMDEADEAE